MRDPRSFRTASGRFSLEPPCSPDEPDQGGPLFANYLLFTSTGVRVPVFVSHLLSCDKCKERDRPCPHRLAQKRIHLLTAEDSLRYVTERLNEGASSGTVRREYQVLVRILNLALRYDKLDGNRFKGVELPDAQKRKRVAEPEELEAISTIREQDHVKRECLEELCALWWSP
jgi:hypothetical protein